MTGCDVECRCPGADEDCVDGVPSDQADQYGADNMYMECINNGKYIVSSIESLIMNSNVGMSICLTIMGISKDSEGLFCDRMMMIKRLIRLTRMRPRFIGHLFRVEHLLQLSLWLEGGVAIK